MILRWTTINVEEARWKSWTLNEMAELIRINFVSFRDSTCTQLKSLVNVHNMATSRFPYFGSVLFTIVWHHGQKMVKKYIWDTFMQIYLLQHNTNQKMCPRSNLTNSKKRRQTVSHSWLIVFQWLMHDLRHSIIVKDVSTPVLWAKDISQLLQI